ncbi:MAG: VOC family protein [Ferruginibacter sp.]
MKRKLAHIALLVHDYDEAIDYYTNKLDFILIEDTAMSSTKRWVLLSPSKEASCDILLAKASNDEQKLAIGNQCGGRVFLFLHTDNLERDYKNYTTKGIKFVRAPVKEAWGSVAVFKDLYGNLWDLIEAI